MRRRCIHELMYQFLKTIESEPMNITNIAHKLHVDTRAYTRILKTLVNFGLVEVISTDSRRKVCKITERGRIYVKMWEELMKLLQANSKSQV